MRWPGCPLPSLARALRACSMDGSIDRGRARRDRKVWLRAAGGRTPASGAYPRPHVCFSFVLLAIARLPPGVVFVAASGLIWQSHHRFAVVVVAYLRPDSLKRRPKLWLAGPFAQPSCHRLKGETGFSPAHFHHGFGVSPGIISFQTFYLFILATQTLLSAGYDLAVSSFT